MSRDFERQRQFTRRAVILGLGQMALASTLLGRLYYLQVIEGDRYSLLSEENRVSLRLIIPPRGLIKDRNGIILAENARNFHLNLIPEKADSTQDTLQKLAHILNLGDSELNRIQNEIKKRKPFSPIVIHNNLNWDQVSVLELNNMDLPGAMIEVGQTRHYPFTDVTSHVLGYVGPVSEYELDKKIFGDDEILRTPELRVGKKGIEKKYEEQLRGDAGSSQLEVNAYGRVIRELETDDGKPGENIDLNIDIELQKIAMQRLEGQSGAAVVMNAHTGAVHVLASAPGFDPNPFHSGIPIKAWEELLNNPRAPLNNKAIAGLYAPGSTFKVVTALAALEYGIADANHHVYCDGHTELGSAVFHCWKKGGHGSLDMTGAIRESCDVYFYDLAMKLGIDKIAEVARRLGLSFATEIDLPGEKSGLIPDRAWKQKRYKQVWHKGESLVAAIGQGYVLATPLQLAVMAAHVVNGARRVVPKLYKNADNASLVADTLDSIGLKFKPSNLAIVKNGMDQVVIAPNGTAHGARIMIDGLAMGGKTGTSQVKRISMAERAQGVIKNENRVWKDRDHALFIGYAPYDQPKYVAAVVVEHGGGGSAVAAPIARDLLLAAQKSDPELRSRWTSEPAPASTTPGTRADPAAIDPDFDPDTDDEVD